MMKHVFSILVLALLATSCAVYAPKTAVVPLLERQGDVQVGAALDASTGLALAAAGAVTDHIGVQLSGDVPLSGETPAYSLRPAAGCFWPLAGGKVSLGVYGGADWARSVYLSKSSLGGTPERRRYDMRSTTLFGQFDAVWAPASWVDIAYRLTCGNLHYDRTLTATPLEEGAEAEAPQVAGGNSLLVENTVQVRLGGPRLKALLSASLAQIPRFPQEQNIYYRPLTFGLGLTYQFKR